MHYGIAVPSLVMGLIFIIVFAVGMKLVPVIAKDWDNPVFWILPTISLVWPHWPALRAICALACWM